MSDANRDKWERLLESDFVLREWINYYRESNPLLSEVSSYLKDKNIPSERKIAIALVALLDHHSNKVTNEVVARDDLSQSKAQEILSLLEGDLSYDRVAEAKKILREVIQ